MYLLLAFAYRYQLNKQILLWSFLELLVMRILVNKENEQDQAHIFQEAYFESSQIHTASKYIQLTGIYCFKHRNHDNPTNFLVQHFHKLFLRARNLHQ